MTSLGSSTLGGSTAAGVALLALFLSPFLG